ncbi:MAG: hypothetical protein J5679_00320 [Alphaproteobacteria bacterium]|nr:hypothetical protein [Alphaproteobacteria bacterium]
MQQQIQDGTLTISRDTKKPNTIIVTAKQHVIAHMIVMPQAPKAQDLFIAPTQELNAKDINEVILNIRDKNRAIMNLKPQDVCITNKKHNHNKNIERLVGNRYTNTQYNQLKKMMHSSRTKHK